MSLWSSIKKVGRAIDPTSKSSVVRQAARAVDVTAKNSAIRKAGVAVDKNVLQPIAKNPVAALDVAGGSILTATGIATAAGAGLLVKGAVDFATKKPPASAAQVAAATAQVHAVSAPPLVVAPPPEAPPSFLHWLAEKLFG